MDGQCHCINISLTKIDRLSLTCALYNLVRTWGALHFPGEDRLRGAWLGESQKNTGESRKKGDSLHSVSWKPGSAPCKAVSPTLGKSPCLFSHSYKTCICWGSYSFYIVSLPSVSQLAPNVPRSMLWSSSMACGQEQGVWIGIPALLRTGYVALGKFVPVFSTMKWGW